MGRASVPTPALYPAFFFVLEKAVKNAGNAVISTLPMHRSYGLQHLRHKQPTRRNRGLPSLVHSAASCCWRNFLFRHAFIYLHFPVLCEPPLYQQREKSGEAAAISFIPTVPHCVFQLLAQTAHVRFHSRKWVHPRLHSKDRTQRLTRRNRGLHFCAIVQGI